MQQTGGDITSPHWSHQTSLYEKSLAEIISVATIKPCLS